MSNVCYLPVTLTNRVESMIQDTQQNFCCAGCVSVCQTIYESGLGAFYDQQTSTLLPCFITLLWCRWQ